MPKFTLQCNQRAVLYFTENYLPKGLTSKYNQWSRIVFHCTLLRPWQKSIQSASLHFLRGCVARVTKWNTIACPDNWLRQGAVCSLFREETTGRLQPETSYLRVKKSRWTPFTYMTAHRVVQGVICWNIDLFLKCQRSISYQRPFVMLILVLFCICTA